jgi:hypothetical protein
MTLSSPLRGHWTPAVTACVAIVLLAMSSPSFAGDDTTPICTDRPTKANSTCTVPAGSAQVEIDMGNTTRDRQGSTTTRTVNIVNPTLKYGLDDKTDLQISWSPHIAVDTRERASDAHHHVSDRGDAYVRLKHRFVDSDSVSVAVIPFVKAPTAAHGIGNDRWEGGVALPVAVPLPGGFALTLGPEVDVLADLDGSGHHAALVNLVNVAHPIGSKMTLAVEVWDSLNRDPSGRIRQRSADVALTYLVTPAWQVDVGANIGITRETPDHQFYLGLSARF